MSEIELLDAIEKLVYYIKRISNEENNDPLKIVKTVKVNSLKSSLLKNKSIITLFKNYTVDQIANAIENDLKTGRYYKYEILSKLYRSKLDSGE